MGLFERLMNDRAPVRNTLRFALRTLGVGGYRFRLAAGALQRQPYAYIMHQGALLASRLGHARISVLEFGVAGGGGLLEMERHATEIERLVPGVTFEIYGFDSGQGLPAPRDYRDLPYHWKPGFFAIDRSKLEVKLVRAKLVFGDVRDTTRTFFADHRPAPIAAVVHDLDFYSSTADALGLFADDPHFLLPRVYCYFDDTLGGETELYNDWTGELLAINEFNAAQPNVKIAPPPHLRVRDGGQAWRHQIWVSHRFDHPEYGRFVSDDDQQRPI